MPFPLSTPCDAKKGFVKMTRSVLEFAKMATASSFRQTEEKWCIKRI